MSVVRGLHVLVVVGTLITLGSASPVAADAGAAQVACPAPPANVSTPYDGPHLTYRTSAGHVEVITAPPSNVYDQVFGYEDATVSSGTSTRAIGTPSAWVSQNDVPEEHLAYRSQDGHVHELWRHTGCGPWVHTDLTKAAGAKARAVGNVAGFGDSLRFVMYRGKDGHLHALTWSSTTKKWRDTDVTKLTHATSDDVSEPYIRNGAVIYRTANGHVHLLQRGSHGWVDTDVWAKAKSKVHALGNPTVYYSSNPAPSVEALHVLFRGTDRHVHELWGPFATGKWYDNDLTKLTGTPANATTDPVGYPQWFGDFDPGLTVSYIGKNGISCGFRKETGLDDPTFSPSAPTPWSGSCGTAPSGIRVLASTPVQDGHIETAWAQSSGHVVLHYEDLTYVDVFEYDVTDTANAPLAATGVSLYYTPTCYACY